MGYPHHHCCRWTLSCDKPGLSQVTLMPQLQVDTVWASHFLHGHAFPSLFRVVADSSVSQAAETVVAELWNSHPSSEPFTDSRKAEQPLPAALEGRAGPAQVPML